MNKSIISMKARLRAFIIQSQGNWSTEDIQEFQEVLGRREIKIHDEELRRQVEIETALLHQDHNKYYICGGGPCSRHESHEEILKHFPRSSSEITICQWGCDSAPVVTLKQGNVFLRFQNYKINDEMKRT